MPGEQWRWSFALPYSKKANFVQNIVHTVHQYLRQREDADGRLQFTVTNDPETAMLLWVTASYDGYSLDRNALMACIQHDIEVLLACFIVDPVQPKSVWDWIRENPYK